MSTTELFLEPDDIEEFIHDTKSTDLLVAIGEEGAEIGICPYITFYMFHNKDEFLDVAQRVIAVFEEFSQLIDEPFERIWRDKSQTWLKAGHKSLPTDLREDAKLAQAEYQMFMLGATDAPNTLESPRWGAWAEVFPSGSMSYSFLKLTFRNKWFQQHKQRWYDFVQSSLLKLQPEQCYSGFEVGSGVQNIMGSYESDVLERICADYFYGMDIDHPSPMRYHSYQDDGYIDRISLGAGLRTPTWCFLLTPIWRKKLGMTVAQVLTALDDPRIEVTVLPYAVSTHNPDGENALWVRLGELDLHPVEKGVPDLLVKATNLIRPIRCDDLKLLTLDPWDDDPNPRFEFDSSIYWMQRFDAESDWPSPEQRHPHKPMPAGPRLRALPGDAVSQAGWWWTPALSGESARRYFKEGEELPEVERTDYGAVIWYFDPQRQGS